jgi:hypothetical protein
VSFLGYKACPDCGIAVHASEVEAHECNHEQWVGYQVAKARGEIERIDSELASYLETPRGKFDLWYAVRTRAA